MNPIVIQQMSKADPTQVALDWLVTVIVVLGAFAIGRVPKETRLVVLAFWLISLRGMFERGFDAYGFDAQENFMKSPITRVPVYLFVIVVLVSFLTGWRLADWLWAWREGKKDNKTKKGDANHKDDVTD